MKSMRNFSIRGSGRLSERYYIDCAGKYKTADIAEITGASKEKVEALYQAHKGELDDGVGVFYFPSREDALDVLKELETILDGRGAGKLVFLTFEEIDYIRQALINEGSNIINVRNDLKKYIFDKFNG